MGRDDDIDLRRREEVAKRLDDFMSAIPSPNNPNKAITETELGKLIGVNQTTVNRYRTRFDPKTGFPSTMYGGIGPRAAIVMIALYAKRFPDAALPIEWWLGVDVVIDAWPDRSVKRTLEKIHRIRPD